MLHACVPSYFAIANFFFQNRLAELLLSYTSFCEIELEDSKEIEERELCAFVLI